ncbi:hypothetical protein [Pseudonocardia humida]|uniref:hypothetical protein n=1 Tax=Pseudonocardia humida TaxID=2800819 RepID=UPI00207C4E94|nr:hypothetical protein [Pseudonocardia humida]
MARDLDAIADEIEMHRQARHPIYLPPELTSAARRIVAAADRPRSPLVAALTPTSEAILQVMDPSEVVTAAIIRDRLAKAEHFASATAISAALHHACVRGDLVSTTSGRFRLPTAEERKILEASREGGAKSTGAAAAASRGSRSERAAGDS